MVAQGGDCLTKAEAVTMAVQGGDCRTEVEAATIRAKIGRIPPSAGGSRCNKDLGRRWASHGSMAKAQEAKAVWQEKVRNVPGNLYWQRNIQGIYLSNYRAKI